MNQKKAKSIRRTMRRLFGRDPREVVTQPKKPVTRFHPNLLNPQKPHIYHWSGQHALMPQCGRAEYQQSKREHKAAKRRGLELLGPAHVYSPAALDAQRQAAA